MSISSMTGYASVAGSAGDWSWTWEARSVNGRGLDLRMRLPSGLESIEPTLREIATKALGRGSITIGLSIDGGAAQGRVRLNETALADVLSAIGRVRELTGAPPPDVAAILAIKGVLEADDKGNAEDESRDRALVETFAQLVAALVKTRKSEGQRLESVILQQLGEISRLAEVVRLSPARTPHAISARLTDQIARLVSSSDAMDPDRLHQEAVVIATRADVAEELARLDAHVEAANELLKQDGPAGRKFDFLAQEFNREANTLCSKANAVDISRAGLALKSVVDQFREQVQNIE